MEDSFGSKDLTDKIYGHIREGELLEAIEILEGLIAGGREDRATFSVLGYCLYQLGEFHKSAEAYQRLTELCPENVQYRYYLALSRFKVGDFDGAFEQCEELDKTPL